MATTAIGTLIPILRDAGELRTRFGPYLLAAGAVGEFGPILLVTLVLSTGHPLHEALILVFFVALAVITGVLAVRTAWRGWPLLERTFETSSQLAVRLSVVLVFGLVALATQLGLDLLLGGFVAGMITRLALRGHELDVFESKLTAVGYGFLIPFFFVTSGMAFNVDELFSNPIALLKLPLFVALFLVVRGVPAMLLYRGVLPLRDRERARRLLRNRAAARGGDHDARAERRRHAGVHRLRARRGGHHLHPGLPAPRPADTARSPAGAWGPGGSRSPPRRSAPSWHPCEDARVRWLDAIQEDRRTYALKLLLVAAVYYGAAKLGLSLAFMNSSISAVWPPTGIALVAIVFWGYRMWPGIALGALLANSWTGIPFYARSGSRSATRARPSSAHSSCARWRTSVPPWSAFAT